MRRDPAVTRRTYEMHATLKRRAKGGAVMSLQDVRAEFDYTMRHRPLCPYCNARLSVVNVSLDHKIPVSRGGSHTSSNLAFVCHSCNVRKGNLTDVEYKDLLKTLDEWAARHRNPGLRDEVLKDRQTANSFRIGKQRQQRLLRQGKTR